MTRFRNKNDGFVGEVIGLYATLEGERGMVLQQIGTKVVHAYPIRWLTPEDVVDVQREMQQELFHHERQSAR